MISKIWIVNILLFVMTLVLSVKAYDVWVSDKYSIIMNAMDDSKKMAVDKLDTHDQSRRPESFYNDIVVKNLFISSRTGKIVEDLMAGSDGSDRSGLQQEIVLYGVTMVGDEKQALISNPYPKADESKTMWVKAGENIADDSNHPAIKITTILNDKVTLLIDGKASELVMFTGADRREHPEAKNEKKTKQPEARDRKKSKIIRRRPDQTKQAQEPSSEISPDGRYKIYNTPFGKIKRRIN